MAIWKNILSHNLEIDSRGTKLKLKKLGKTYVHHHVILLSDKQLLKYGIYVYISSLYEFNTAKIHNALKTDEEGNYYTDDPFYPYIVDIKTRIYSDMFHLHRYRYYIIFEEPLTNIQFEYQ